MKAENLSKAIEKCTSEDYVSLFDEKLNTCTSGPWKVTSQHFNNDAKTIIKIYNFLLLKYFLFIRVKYILLL